MSIIKSINNVIHKPSYVFYKYVILAINPISLYQFKNKDSELEIQNPLIQPNVNIHKLPHESIFLINS